LRERATLTRRDIAKMVAAGVEEGIDADWPALHSAFRSLVDRLPRTPARDVLEPLVADLSALAATVLAILQTHMERAEPQAAVPTSPSPDGDHTDIESEISPQVQPSDPDSPKPAPTAIPIRLVVEACPDILDYSRSEIRSVRDLFTTACLVCSLLGVSPSAWQEACAAMGEGQASIVLAAILQKGATIKNAGGYLRTLTRRAASGQFSAWSMLMALRTSRHRIEAAEGRRSPKFFPLPDE
jgi:replication initiation protein RepC